MVAEQHKRGDRLRRNRNELVLVADQISQFDFGLSAASNIATVQVDLANLLAADGQVIRRFAVVATSHGHFAVELELPGWFSIGEVDRLHLVPADENDLALVHTSHEQ